MDSFNFIEPIEVVTYIDDSDSNSGNSNEIDSRQRNSGENRSNNDVWTKSNLQQKIYLQCRENLAQRFNKNVAPATSFTSPVSNIVYFEIIPDFIVHHIFEVFKLLKGVYFQQERYKIFDLYYHHITYTRDVLLPRFQDSAFIDQISKHIQHIAQRRGTYFKDSETIMFLFDLLTWCHQKIRHFTPDYTYMNPGNIPPNKRHGYNMEVINGTSKNNQDPFTTQASATVCRKNNSRKANTREVRRDTTKVISEHSTRRLFSIGLPGNEVSIDVSSSLYDSISKEIDGSNNLNPIKSRTEGNTGLSSDSTAATGLPTRSSLSRDSGICSPLNTDASNNMYLSVVESPEMNENVYSRLGEKLNESGLYGLCCVCRNVTKFKCKGCFWLYYCSNKCQESHWPLHQTTCFRKS
ncbi:uncharacterized protein LOC126977410 isoform X3 [Leptidea sinapis]|uniref:uncharacterized protein LOC126977410 isoform X2 n=1 Tax=Leptidea sinapis TaxID=189913 RepID=UPI0021367DBE|nr:uncharacterized protein LOC126977410 isoform X2 [Leptidea sinapis]XP_050682159.1 uncharacterized protein LOC126977410 isoform X2 [Leptidea sinapis]XP_050682160.1 uncharacterized protein LOC126977410 isoform X3 [Leptidea sinapis]